MRQFRIVGIACDAQTRRTDDGDLKVRSAADPGF